MTAQPRTTSAPNPVLAAIAAAAARVGIWLAGATGALRAARRAEYLLSLSDAELAKLGIPRGRIVNHASARYLGG